MCLPSTFWRTERRTVVMPMKSQFGCLKLLITRTFLSGPVKFEIMRVDCTFLWRNKKKYFPVTTYSLELCNRIIINPCQAEYIEMPHPLLIASQSDCLNHVIPIHISLMTDIADPDPSGSTLFAKVRHSRVQQDQA